MIFVNHDLHGFLVVWTWCKYSL